MNPISLFWLASGLVLIIIALAVLFRDYRAHRAQSHPYPPPPPKRPQPTRTVPLGGWEDADENALLAREALEGLRNLRTAGFGAGHGGTVVGFDSATGKFYEADTPLTGMLGTAKLIEVTDPTRRSQLEEMIITAMTERASERDGDDE